MVAKQSHMNVALIQPCRKSICRLLATALGALTLTPAMAQDFHITAAGFDSARRPVLEFQNDTNSYFVLYRGDTVTNLSPIVLELGADAGGMLVDPESFDGENATRFFFIHKVPLAAPVDTDGDGIDDLYELAFPGILDPLNAADGEEDPDKDDLTNVEEYMFGTNPELADSDGDGWIDSIEIHDGTDPLNPASRPQQSLLSQPPALVELPSPDAAGTSGSALLLAGPPLALDVPSADASGAAGVGIVLARPPVLVDVLSLDAAGAAGSAVFLAQPPVAIDVPSADAAGASGIGALLAYPPVLIDLPSADTAGASGSAVTLAQPPVNVRLNSQ